MTKIIQNGPNYSKWPQIIPNGPKWYIMAHNYSYGPKWKKEHKSVRNTQTKHKRYKVIWHKVSKKDLSFFLQISWNKVSLWPMADTISSPLNHPRLLWRQMVRMTRTGVASIKDNGRYLRLAYYQPNISPSLDPSQIFINIQFQNVRNLNLAYGQKKPDSQYICFETRNYIHVYILQRFCI